ncbi:hypothetical protein PoB_002074500 [Plakobranchus ocellatus]|uniref:Uncharacterized protein n=1 Tax=Plakobranchus ocellatus TaxID=259542 RepID=A0AAV3ZI29_9GAST|nr:hypothetical protein PoB_002074500 [Plakobranchus ocellatus]
MGDVIESDFSLGEDELLRSNCIFNTPTVRGVQPRYKAADNYVPVKRIRGDHVFSCPDQIYGQIRQHTERGHPVISTTQKLFNNRTRRRQYFLPYAAVPPLCAGRNRYFLFVLASKTFGKEKAPWCKSEGDKRQDNNCQLLPF